MLLEMIVDVVADHAERWVIRRRVSRYHKKASLFGCGEKFERLIAARIDAAKPQPVDFSAIVEAYCVALDGVSGEPMMRLVKGGHRNKDRTTEN